MKRIDNPGVLLSVVKDALVRQIKWQSVLIIISGLGLIVLLSRGHPASAPKWLLDHREEDNSTSLLRDAKRWNTWTTRAGDWEIHRADRDEEDQKNWVSRQKMRKLRSAGSLWWDERAEQVFISKLEKSQFPANCSEAHWLAHYDFVSGLMSSVHVFQIPLFFAMVRGHTLVPISDPHHHPAFDGCGPNISDRNILCYFQITGCNPGDRDDQRLWEILADPFQHESFRTPWEQVLMEDDDFFPPGGVTVIRSWKLPMWETEVCVDSSLFLTFADAYNYHKVSVWDAMGSHGQVGVVRTSELNKTTPANGACSAKNQDLRLRRVDMVMISLMSSWMLNRMPTYIKAVADDIMSRYENEMGQPLWQPPVMAIHIRQTDKSREDPYFVEHGSYRPIEDYALHMKQMEEEYGVQWPSIFLISDSGVARETFVKVLNGNDSLAPTQGPQLQQEGKRYIMYDWIENDHLQDTFRDHSHVPRFLKHDMQVHFLATLYIVQKIADHAIVTHSSNVGRFINEIMSAKHRLAYTEVQGPLVTSLDYPWWWA